LDGLAEADYLLWAYHQNEASETDYYAQTHALPSPDGNKLVFATDWSGFAEAYVVDLRPTLPME
jgi:hypothetical protein